MSLVDLVIREAVEKELKSLIENFSTLVNKFSRKCLDSPVAIRDAKKPTITAQTPPIAVTPIISSPLCQIESRFCAMIPSLTMSAILSGSHKFAITEKYVKIAKTVNQPIYGLNSFNMCFTSSFLLKYRITIIRRLFEAVKNSDFYGDTICEFRKLR